MELESHFRPRHFRLLTSEHYLALLVRVELHSLLVEALVVLPLVLDLNIELPKVVGQIREGSYIQWKQLFEMINTLNIVSVIGGKWSSDPVLLQCFWREILLVLMLLGWTVSSWWYNIPVTFLSRQLLDMKIFVDTDSDIRLVRRLRRDITERGRDIEGVIKQYNKFVKPAFEQYIEPTMRLADIVVPRGA